LSASGDLIVLGVDPGTEHCGLAQVHFARQPKPESKNFGDARLAWTLCLSRKRRQDVGAFLADLARAMREMHGPVAWSLVGCEDVYIDRRKPRAVIQLAQVVGVVRAMAAVQGAKFQLVTAPAWRLAATGLGEASYVFLREILCERFPGQGLRDVTEHELAAVGVACGVAR